MELRCDRTQSLCQDGIGATMEKSDRLAIALHGHATHDSVRRSLKNLDTHLGSEFAAATLEQEIHVIGDLAIGHATMIAM